MTNKQTKKRNIDGSLLLLSHLLISKHDINSSLATGVYILQYSIVKNSNFSTDGCFVFPGDTLDVTYYGQHLNLRVMSVKGPKASSINLQTTRNDNHPTLHMQPDRLDEQFQSLSISDCSEENNVTSVIEKKSDPDKEPTHTRLLSDVQLKEERKKNSNDETNYCSAGYRTSDLFYYISSDETSMNTRPYGAKSSSEEQQEHRITFSSIGGLDAQIKTVREMIEMPLKYPEMFAVYGKRFRLSTSIK